MRQKYGVIYITKLIYEIEKYPGELLRDYIFDVIFASFIKINQDTLEWLKIALSNTPLTILTEAEKIEMVNSLN